MNTNVLLPRDELNWRRYVFTFLIRAVLYNPDFAVFFCATAYDDELLVFAEAYVYVVSGVVVDEDGVFLASGDTLSLYFVWPIVLIHLGKIYGIAIQPKLHSTDAFKFNPIDNLIGLHAFYSTS